jgi:hypothetical protein
MGATHAPAGAVPTVQVYKLEQSQTEEKEGQQMSDAAQFSADAAIAEVAVLLLLGLIFNAWIIHIVRGGKS